MEVTTGAATAWFVAQRDNLFIIAERKMRDKVFAMGPGDQDFSIITRGKKTVLGELLRVDMSPEALLEGLDIREGDKILLLPRGSGVAA